MTRREPTVGEERASALSHGAGAVASAAAVPVLVITAAGRGDPWQVAGVAVFGAMLVLLYLASTVYHALPPSRAKRVARRLDHAAIYLLIAGTYAPVMLVGLRGAWGWTLFAVVWAMAVTGVVLKLVFGCERLVRVSTAGYLAMGWLSVLAIRPILASLTPGALVWLGVGGLAYTAGVAFFIWERQRYAHAVWHLFVLGGSAAHVWAVWAHVLPATA